MGLRISPLVCLFPRSLTPDLPHSPPTTPFPFYCTRHLESCITLDPALPWLARLVRSRVTLRCKGALVKDAMAVRHAAMIEPAICLDMTRSFATFLYPFSATSPALCAESKDPLRPLLRENVDRAVLLIDNKR